MTIALMIESVGLGGAEMVVLQLGRELRARGHTVHVLVPAGREGYLTDELRRSSLPFHGYDLRRPIDHGFPGRLGAQLRAIEVDVVHSHEFVMSVYGAAAARRLGVPHVITMHGNQWMTQKLQRRIALRWAFRNSDHVVAVSADTRDHLRSSLGLWTHDIQVIHNGIPAPAGERARVRRELGLEPSELLILSVGSLSPRKAHAVLLEAAAQLGGLGVADGWRVAIAGEGPERPRLEGLIRTLNLEGRAQLLGTRTDVADLQAAADVFALPSLWEGLPLAILEAMFGGNAVIASDISGIPEAIGNGHEGILVAPGNVAQLAEALARVLLDPVCRDRLAAAGFARAQRQFTIDAMVTAYEHLYGCMTARPLAAGAAGA